MSHLLASRYRPRPLGASAVDKAVAAAEAKERSEGKATTVPIGDQRVRMRGVPIIVPPRTRRR